MAVPDNVYRRLVLHVPEKLYCRIEKCHQDAQHWMKGVPASELDFVMGFLYDGCRHLEDLFRKAERADNLVQIPEIKLG